MRRAEHRGKVTTKFAGVADVERQQVEQIVTQLAGIVEFDRRDTQPLLPDLRGRRIIATMGAAPMSLWCARTMVQSRRLPSANTGTNTVTSGRWLPP